jgi:hypothetical protein
MALYTCLDIVTLITGQSSVYARLPTLTLKLQLGKAFVIGRHRYG